MRRAAVERRRMGLWARLPGRVRSASIANVNPVGDWNIEAWRRPVRPQVEPDGAPPGEAYRRRGRRGSEVAAKRRRIEVRQDPGTAKVRWACLGPGAAPATRAWRSESCPGSRGHPIPAPRVSTSAGAAEIPRKAPVSMVYPNFPTIGGWRLSGRCDTVPRGGRQSRRYRCRCTERDSRCCSRLRRACWCLAPARRRPQRLPARTIRPAAQVTPANESTAWIAGWRRGERAGRAVWWRHGWAPVHGAQSPAGAGRRIRSDRFGVRVPGGFVPAPPQLVARTRT